MGIFFYYNIFLVQGNIKHDMLTFLCFVSLTSAHTFHWKPVIRYVQIIISSSSFYLLNQDLHEKFNIIVSLKPISYPLCLSNALHMYQYFTGNYIH